MIKAEPEQHLWAENYDRDLRDWGFAPVGEMHPKAKEAALKALEIGDTLSGAHLSLGLVHWLSDWDLPAAVVQELSDSQHSELIILRQSPS